MKFMFAATSAYDMNEIYVWVLLEEGECIKVGDMIDIPMIDHSFEKREIMGFVSKKKGVTITKVEVGETGQIEFIVNNIHSGRIKTESNLYTDEDYSGAVTAYHRQGG
ncbi:MAG: hypothetical protein K2M46_02260 [Lachnospiraceae bacterium]|nr:hypothetical protein [Lachnospiraceae bacterium]